MAAVTPLPARMMTARYGYSPRPIPAQDDACQALGKAPPDNLHWIASSRLRSCVISVQLWESARGSLAAHFAYIVENRHILEVGVRTHGDD